MDPEATLYWASRAIEDGNPIEAHRLLAEYTAWRGRGGVEPRVDRRRGDLVARELGRWLGSQTRGG